MFVTFYSPIYFLLRKATIKQQYETKKKHTHTHIGAHNRLRCFNYSPKLKSGWFTGDSVQRENTRQKTTSAHLDSIQCWLLILLQLIIYCYSTAARTRWLSNEMIHVCKWWHCIIFIPSLFYNIYVRFLLGIYLVQIPIVHRFSVVHFTLSSFGCTAQFSVIKKVSIWIWLIEIVYAICTAAAARILLNIFQR